MEDGAEEEGSGEGIGTGLLAAKRVGPRLSSAEVGIYARGAAER